MTVPYQIDLLTPRQKLQIHILIGAWAMAAIYFLVWWFRPSHFTDAAHFTFNSFIVLWNIVLPGYYFYFLRRMKKPNPAVLIPAEWRIAIVATRAPSESFELVKKMLLAMKAQDLKADVWLADEDPTPAIYGWCKAQNIFVSTRKGIPAYHQAEWPRRTRCKEGNLAFFYDNYGYEQYDFVAQMDADHIPVPSYLRNMIRPFIDPEIGYVSAPSICDANAKRSWIELGKLGETMLRTNNTQKLALILTVVGGLITTAIDSQAGLGWTMTKCKQEYGRPRIGPKTDLAGRKKYQFEIKGYVITAFFLEDKVSRISYHKNSDITAQDLPTLLTMGAPNPIWGHAYQDPSDKEGAWHWVDNSNSLFASLVDSNTVLIWTKYDIDTLRAAIKSERM